MEVLEMGEYIVDSEGRKKAVILPVEVYEKLMEDLHDLAVAAERRDEETISLTELKERLARDGLLDSS
jgi:PHD/YefM family antitoxin component YafN of YafNO toxin-antitoxin module